MRIMYLALPILVSLIGCKDQTNKATIPKSEAPSSAAGATALVTPQWFVGAWAPQGSECDSGAATAYRKDGTWFDEFGGGKWSLSEGVVNIDTLYSFDDEGSKRNVSTPTVFMKIVSSDENKFTGVTRSESTVYNRCPSQYSDTSSKSRESEIIDNFKGWQTLQIASGNYEEDKNCNFSSMKTSEGIGFPPFDEIKIRYKDFNGDGVVDGKFTYNPIQCDGGNALGGYSETVTVESLGDGYSVRK